MCRRILLFLYLLLPFQAHSTIIDNGDWTADTISGLDWLDMKFTKSMSYDSVLSATTANDGNLLSGWRYATKNDLKTLIDAFDGLDIPASSILISQNVTSDYYPIANDDIAWSKLFEYICPECNGIIEDTIKGLYNDQRGMSWSFATSFVNSYDTPTDWYDFEYNYSINNLVRDDFSSWLVRDSINVPEPSVITLLGIGLFGLVTFRRKIKK